MMTNREFIQKATITTDTFVNAGLTTEQAAKFIDYVVDETTMKAKIRVEKFKASKREIYKLGVADRVMVPKIEAADPGVRFGVTSSTIALEPKRVTCPFELSEETLEQTVEGEDVEDRVIKMMATRFANNLEQFAWHGNTLGPARLHSYLRPGGSSTLYMQDGLMALSNGWLKRAESGHVLDAQNGPITPDLLARLLNAIPEQYQKDERLMAFLASSQHARAYASYLSGRQDKVGTDALEGKVASPFGVDLEKIALLSAAPYYVEHVVLTGTTPSALAHAPITNVVVTTSTLGINPEAAYILTTDYTVNLAAGTITRNGAGAISSGQTVKVTYQTGGKLMATLWKNIILAVGLDDLKIKRSENVIKDVQEYVIHASAQAMFEEEDAVGLLKNLKTPY